MNSIKWETVKDLAANSGLLTQEEIDNWDIRCARKLIERCKLKFNGYTKRCKTSVDYNEDFDWILIFE